MRECLKELQKELFDIVELKTEIYQKRHTAEYGHPNPDYENEETVKHEIEKIREELFNLPFEQAGTEIIQKF